MRDPYTVLGVTRNAAAADIKKAFRKLAKTWHPDQSKDPRAKEKFAELNQAYEILGDEKKRGQFDRGEIDAEGKPRGFEGFGPGGFRPGAGGAGPGGFHYEYRTDGDPRGGGHAGFDAGDIFADLFGFGGKRGGQAHQARPRGEDIAATATVSLVEAVKGGKTRVIMPTGRTLEVSVPAGIDDGKQIRLKGQGNPGAMGGEPGDAIITVRIAKHPVFRVDGRDMRMDLPVTLYEAVLGGKVNAPTLDGAVELGVPPGSSSGRTLRLRGKGLPAAGGHSAGDLYVTLKIVLPPDGGADLAELMRRWEKDKRYDPRAGMA
jgi:DnaJ-class molecular chaperone